VPALERIVFFGTPAFARPSLDALVAAGRRPALVVSQPARPAGRGRREVEPEVARRARELGLPLAQPARVRDPAFLESIAAFEADLGVVVAFGQIFPRALLELPREGCLNLHASLLPRWRGAAPIAAAIEAGDETTGVSVQRMVEALDAGPVLGSAETRIGAEETAGELGERLAGLGAQLLLRVIEELETGRATAIEQDEAEVTFAPKLAGPARLDLRRSAVELERLVRARQPAPGADLEWREGALRVLRARAATPGIESAAPGVCLGVEGGALRVAAGEGTALDLLRVQRPGRPPVSGPDFANGARLRAGDRLAAVGGEA